MDIATLGIRVDYGQVSAATRELDKLSDTGARTETATGRMSAGFLTLRNAIAGLGVAAAVREFVQAADSMQLTNARLRLVTESAQELAEVQGLLYDAAQRNSQGLQEVTTLYTKLAPAIKEVGGGVRETTALVDAFSLSLKVSGASTQEAAAATLQFAQAMASGKLSGDEFRSLAETAPRLMRAFADSIGVPVGALKEMAAEGKLTADVVGNALVGSIDKLRAEAASLPDTVGQAFQRLQNDALTAADEINQQFNITGNFAEGIEGIRELLPDLVGATRTAAESIVENMDAVGFAAGSVAAVGLGRAAAAATAMAVQSAALAAAALKSTVQYDALGVALTRTTVAQNAYNVAARAGAGVIAGLGGPIGALVTVLGIAASAWYAFGDAGQSAAEQTEAKIDAAARSIERLRNQAKFGAGDVGLIRDAIASVEAEMAKLAETESRRGTSAQANQEWLYARQRIAELGETLADLRIGLVDAEKASGKQDEALRKLSTSTTAAGKAAKGAAKDLDSISQWYRDEYEPMLELEARENRLLAEQREAVQALLGPLERQADLAERELENYGKAESEIQRVLVARLEEARAIAAANGATAEHLDFLDREIDARKRLMEASASRESLEEQTAMWRSIDQVAHDTFVSIFDSGKDAFERLRDTLKNSLYDLLYQMTVRKWIIQLSANVSGDGVAGAVGQAVGGGGYGSGGLISSGSTLYSAGSALYGYGQAFGTGYSAAAAGTDLSAAAGAYYDAGYYGTGASLQAGQGAYSQTAAGSFGNVAAGGISGYYLGQQATGSTAGGVAGAAAGAYAAYAIPYVGWALAALALLQGSGLIGSDGPHQGGAAFSTIGGMSGLADTSNTAGFNLGWGAYRANRGGDRSSQIDEFVSGLIGQVADNVATRAERYGGSAEGVRVTGRYAVDPDDARGAFRVQDAGGAVTFERYKDYDGADNASQLFASDALRAEIAALQNANLDQVFADILGSVDPLNDSLETLSGALAFADEVVRQLAVSEDIRSLASRDAMQDAEAAADSAFASWFRAGEGIRAAAAAGALSVDQMAQLAAEHYANEVALLQQIQSLSASMAERFESSIRSATLSTLDNEGKYDFFDKEAARFRDVLMSITDPTEIERYGEKLRGTLDSAFNVLSPEQQVQYLDQFIDRYTQAGDLVQERLEAAQSVVQEEQRSFMDGLAQSAADGIRSGAEAAADTIRQAGAAIPREVRVTNNVNVSASPLLVATVSSQVNELGDGP